MKTRVRPRNIAARALKTCRPKVHRDRTKYTRKGRKPRGPHGAFAHHSPAKGGLPADAVRHATHAL